MCLFKPRASTSAEILPRRISRGEQLWAEAPEPETDFEIPALTCTDCGTFLLTFLWKFLHLWNSGRKSAWLRRFVDHMSSAVFLAQRKPFMNGGTYYYSSINTILLLQIVYYLLFKYSGLFKYYLKSWREEWVAGREPSFPSITVGFFFLRKKMSMISFHDQK